MQPGSYIQKLTELLPKIHQETLDTNGWESLVINRRKPYTYRIWKMFGEDRVCLHQFDECDRAEAFLHPHPWPAAFLILRGGYFQTLGRSHDLFDEPEQVAETYMAPGSMYEIVSPQTWHSVIPKEKTFTVMVNGPPFNNPHQDVRTTKGKDLDTLSRTEITASLTLFRQMLNPYIGKEPLNWLEALRDMSDALERNR